MQKTSRFGFEIDKRRRRGIAKGLVLFAAVLFLVFITTGAYADQICSDCHDTGPHGACDAGNCAACHGNPPVNAGGLIHPYANMPGPVASGSVSAGAHAIHATATGSNYACSTCHYSGMSASSGQLVGGTNNGNGTLQMGFNILGAGGGTYDGLPALAYPYEGTNGTAVTSGGTKTCSNIYCHSDGTSVSTNVVPVISSPGWETAGPLACSTCHGFPPAYVSQYPKANSHNVHVAFTCNICHYATTTDGYTVTDFTRHKNANGVYDVVPDPNASYHGTPVSFSYVFDPGGGQCSNISCHGPVPNSKTWGGVELSAGISWTNGPNCFEVRLTGYLNGIPPQVFNWNFGDGQTGTGETITHYYPHAGTYSVQLSAIDSRNRRAATVQPQVIAKAVNLLPVPDRTVTVSGYTVTVTDFSTDPDYNSCDHTGPGSVMVQWGPAGVPDTEVSADLTDVRPTVGRTISRTYTTAGTYTLKHAVKDNGPSPYVYSGNTQVIVPSTYSVSGKVTRLDGTTPVSGASMRLKKGSSVVKIATTNVSGDYTFTNVLPDSYTVQAIKSGLTFPVEPPAVVINSNVTGVNISATR